MNGSRNSAFKRVPAVDKSFKVLHLVARCKKPLGISEISRQLGLNKSTVFNLVYTLSDLHVLEQTADGKFSFGTQMYVLGRAAGAQTELVMTVRPHLEEISRTSNFSAFFGIRSDLKTMIVDKVDAAGDLRMTADVGVRFPLFAGASGKALLCQLSDSELDEILASKKLEKFTPLTCVDKKKFKRAVLEVRERGVAVDVEEYIEGIAAVAVPLHTHRPGVEAAIWVVGLARHISDEVVSQMCQRLKAVAEQLSTRFSNA
jgi:DNA-binding IclR family transcriptional regulator